MTICRFILILLLVATTGCGTSKWTDTGRSATEQLLITDAMDRAVSELDLSALAGRTCFIDATPLKKISDSEYLVSCMRQHMFASGCIVKDSKGDADYIVEVRAGAVGTDRHDVLYGVPAVNVPSVVPVTGIPSQIPEMPFVKKTDQRAVVKLSLFAYNQKTGRPVWQSGAVPQESNAKAVWVLGAGPFQRGTIYDGMEFAGDKLNVPLVDIYRSPETAHVSVADEVIFPEAKAKVAPEERVESAVAAAEEKKPDAKPTAKAKEPDGVVPAGHAEASPRSQGQPSEPPDAKVPSDATKEVEKQANENDDASSYPPNDLAAALEGVSSQAMKPRLLVKPDTIPQQQGASPLAAPRPIIPE